AKYSVQFLSIQTQLLTNLLDDDGLICGCKFHQYNKSGQDCVANFNKFDLFHRKKLKLLVSIIFAIQLLSTKNIQLGLMKKFPLQLLLFNLLKIFQFSICNQTGFLFG
ncbi:MAG: hypothetical protein U9N34_10710, partial [Candidatus Cloacimonadota bacterium]|nr:hypothetical protein [Candidatus Cloacimonadota bacterium]